MSRSDQSRGPDAEDRLFYHDSEVKIQSQTVTVYDLAPTPSAVGQVTHDFMQAVGSIPGPDNYGTRWHNNGKIADRNGAPLSGAIADNFKISFLGSQVTSAYSAAAFADPADTSVAYGTVWDPVIGLGEGNEQLSALSILDHASGFYGWFIVGGHLTSGVGGSSIVQNSGTSDGPKFNVTMPQNSGLQNAGATSSTSITSGAVATNLFNFDPAGSVVVINGAPIDPNAAGGEVSLIQNGGDTEIWENGSLLAALVGVSLTTWQSVAAAQSLGTASDDTLTGTGAAEFFAAGAGDDTIKAAGGDDTIIYTSGNDLIVGSGIKNTGFDTLDLSKYSSDQVSFTINSSHDVIVTTPDGVIELDYQVRYDPGHTASNIDQILFSDITLDEVAIRARALGDQSTNGDDAIRGSFVGDLILDGAGNDTITSWSGDDTIVYQSGDDVIVGRGQNSINAGNDALDLSMFSSDEVRFDVNDYDVLITTPNGVIELDYQVRYDIGHANSNIEQILFSDGSLDEAGIRARAVADQATTGADAIAGTNFGDRIGGGLGNDTLTGQAGTDAFVFATGDGDDQITDFALSSDLIEFAGLTFSDLTITQSGNDTLIDYGASDSLLLLAIDHNALTQSDFVFI